MPLIDCQNLSVKINENTLLQDISFTVNSGDYLIVLGANGSGKSTLLRCLLGVQLLNQGQITIDGKPLQQYRRRHLSRMISYVPQASTGHYNFSVEHFIRMARYPYHSPLSSWLTEDEHAVDKALHITETTALRQRSMQTLSGGECQRVLIAAALCQSTPIMLLDEPTSHLDPHHQVAVHRLVKQLNKEHGITVIEVSHDINHAAQHARQVLALKQGRLLWHSNSQSLMQTERLQQLYEQSFIMLRQPQTGDLIAVPDENA